MFNKKTFRRGRNFNIVVSVVLVVVLLAFYKIANISYSNKLKEISANAASNLGYLTTYTAANILEEIGDEAESGDITIEFIKFCGETFGTEIYEKIIDFLKDNEYTPSMWYDVCGATLNVLKDIMYDKVTDYNYILKSTKRENFSIAFVGDISLDNNWEWSPLRVFANNRDKLVENAFSADLIAEMRNASLLCANSEAPITDATTRLNGVYYHISSASSDASVLNDIGIDMVNIANDRIYDYSAQGFVDTIKFIEDVGVSYIGGGLDIEDAKLPRYAIIGGMKIAFVASAYANSYAFAPEATESSAGIIYNLNSTHIYDMISEASENADYVVVYTDWGIGFNATADATQKSIAHSFVDAGADLVVGCRSMMLQSIEYYNGTPIVYGLGNFWYETDPHDTILLRVDFVDGAPNLYCLPCNQKGAVTTLVAGSEQGNAILEHIVKISGDAISFDENGKLIQVVSDK